MILQRSLFQRNDMHHHLTFDGVVLAQDILTGSPKIPLAPGGPVGP